MKILLTANKKRELHHKAKLRRERDKSRAICRDIDKWYTELMILPLDARISKVAYAIAREAIYSVNDGDVSISVSLARI